MTIRPTFRALSVRNFRLFYFGQGLSQIGTWVQVVAVSLLVLELTGSGVSLGFVPVAQFAPVLALGPWAGLLADRHDRHRLLLVLSVVGALGAGLFCVVVFAEATTLMWAYGLTALSGIVQAMENPIRRVLLTDLVDAGDIPNAVGLFSAMMTTSRVIGPALAGLVILGPGLVWCFALNALSYVVQVMLLLRLDRSRFRAQQRVAAAPGQLVAGLSYAWNNREIKQTLLITAAVTTLALNYPVVLPLLATRDLGGSGTAYTTLFAVLSVGSVMGSLAVARRSDVDPRFVSVGALALGVSTLVLAGAPNLVSAALLAVPVGFFGVLVVSGANTVVQLRSAPEYRGRVLALITVVVAGSNPIGGPVIGFVSELSSARVGLALGGGAAVVAGTAGLAASAAGATSNGGERSHGRERRWTVRRRGERE
jgi:MFS family permease